MFRCVDEIAVDIEGVRKAERVGERVQVCADLDRVSRETRLILECAHRND